MNQILETFLLTIAQVSAILLGLLMVAFFYVETGLRRVSSHGSPKHAPTCDPQRRSLLRCMASCLPSPSRLSF
jgi:hypothetical protein